VKEVPALATSPLFLVAESYGGKYAATLGASIARAVRAGELNITLGGSTSVQHTALKTEPKQH
jgi:serine carboxypeptidase 1